MEMQPYIVYIKSDEQNRIKSVNSSAFLRDTDGWVEIDRGFDDKHHHAQGNYFPSPIYDERGIMRYMTAPIADYPDREAYHVYKRNGEQWGIYERTQEEMDADYIPPVPAASIEKRVENVEGKTAELEESLDMLLSGVTADV